MKKSNVMLAKDFQSSFLSAEKDTETILRKLFIESQPYSDQLKKLLVINTKDCLDAKDSEVYNNIIQNTTIKTLQENGYITLIPKIKFPEHEEVKTYIIVSFDTYAPNGTNPQFRDCIINFDIVCHTDCWDLGNFRQRPLKIAGYIDGILNNSKLSGIGTLQFAGLNLLSLNQNLSGYVLSYYAVHGSDDKIPNHNG